MDFYYPTDVLEDAREVFVAYVRACCFCVKYEVDVYFCQ